MALHLMCITSVGGLPIFTRKKGDGENLNFSVTGSLNGVYLFCKSHSVDIQSTTTQDGSIIVWKEFLDSLMLIAISPSSSLEGLTSFLNSVYNAMVLYVGVDELKDIKIVERLKHDLRPCYPLLDRLMETIDSNLPYTECLICPDYATLLTFLESYSESICSPFSCLIIHGRMAAATDAWWDLDVVERNLLTAVALLDQSIDSAKDVPVFLPYKSPNVAFRFIWIPISASIYLLALCGPKPLLEEIPRLMRCCWSQNKAQEAMASAVECIPRNFPFHIQLDATILGILLINISTGKFMISRSPQKSTNSKRAVSGAHRLDILTAFYHQAMATAKVTRISESVNIHEKESNEPLSDRSSSGLKNNDTFNDSLIWDGFESYWCSEYHKCHCLGLGDNLLCILYGAIIPMHTMRIITQHTMKLLLSDKIHW